MACFKERKKIQRKFNKAVRRINRDIENDDLWRGRFIIRQTKSVYNEDKEDDDYTFKCLGVYFTLIDKATGKKLELYENIYPELPHWSLNLYLFTCMNDFIIKTVRAWDIEPNPRTDKTDYRKIDY